jgi:hypothetical protein
MCEAACSAVLAGNIDHEGAPAAARFNEILDTAGERQRADA